jgi:hypothetical protein
MVGQCLLVEKAMKKRRIVVIDGHIIAQFHNGLAWWTCTKAANGNESDFAVWPQLPTNLAKARKLVGDAPIISSARKPIEVCEGWYATKDGTTGPPRTYREVLRELARSLA